MEITERMRERHEAQVLLRILIVIAESCPTEAHMVLPLAVTSQTEKWIE